MMSLSVPMTSDGVAEAIIVVLGKSEKEGRSDDGTISRRVDEFRFLKYWTEGNHRPYEDAIYLHSAV